MADIGNNDEASGESSPNIVPSSASDGEFSGFEDQEAIRRGAVLVETPMSDYAPDNDQEFPIDIESGWGKNDSPPVVAPFTRQSKLNIEMDSTGPIDYFKLFFKENMFQLIKEQTNLYAEQHIDRGNLSPNSRFSSWTPVTDSEVKNFFSLIICMGLVHKTHIEKYWSTSPVNNTPYFSARMPRDRFLCILYNLHLVNNELDDRTDPLFKVRPMISHTSETFSSVYTPEEYLSFDEATCPWKWRLRFKVYNPAKPCKFGIKLFQACEAQSGYCCGYDVYAGKGAPSAGDLCEALDLDPGLTQTTKIVIGVLAKCGLLEAGYRVFMDNYYTSPELFTELDLLGTYACGTLRVNRKGVPDAVKRKRKLQQNEVIYRRNGNILAIKFHDKRDVHMISTFHEATMAVLNKKVYGTDLNVTKPQPVVDYIKHMGGVDLSVQFNQYNTVMRKSQKWWKKLFFHLLNVCIVNAYCMYLKFSEDVSKMSHYEFRMGLVQALANESGSIDIPQVPRRRRTEEVPERLTGRHFPEYIPAKPGAKRAKPIRNCFACNVKKSERVGAKRNGTAYWCATCKVALCIPDCFRVFHTHKHYRHILCGEGQEVSSDSD